MSGSAPSARLRLSSEKITTPFGNRCTASISLSNPPKVSISDSNIENWVRAAMAAYTKKAEYGTASIEADQVTMQGSVSQFLIQTGSWISLDGEYFSGTDLDVEALYDGSVTGQLAQGVNP